MLLTILFWSLWTSASDADTLTDRLTGSPDVPWQISADKVDYDAESTTYRASGKVVIEKQATRLMADSVAFNHNAMTAHAAGHVVLTVGDDLLTGDRLDLNLDQETGVVYDGSLFLKENHFYIRGDRIEKTGKNTYRARTASVTSCDGDRPDWIITGRTIEVTIEGYGTASHATLKARDIPVLYLPYLIFPAKTRRQTGLLVPEAGVSDRKGFTWDQPLFWAINDSSDATLYGLYMAERGTKVGLEYRYAQSDTSFGVVMADGLEDRKIDDGTPENTLRWGYVDDEYDRPNTDRYWLRAKMDRALPLGATARLDLDIVSDQDYLTEFREGRSGFDVTRNRFLETFGRDLDTYDDDIRTNRLNVNRTWSQSSLNGDLRWNDNVTNRRWENTDDTLQQLPFISFDAIKQQAFGSFFYWNLDSEYTYFYRQDGSRGHRSDIYPRAYLPLNWKNYLFVEPSVGWRQTAWVMDRRENDELDRSNYRQIVDARLDLSTEFSKVLRSPVRAADRIRHSIQPRVIYEYIPSQDQSDLPSFTDLDRIEESNRVTYSLTNLFTARTTRMNRGISDRREGNGPSTTETPPIAATAAPMAPASLDYHRFCRFYLEQSYDIDAEKENDIEPFSDIFGELDLNFGRYLAVDSDARFNVYDNNVTSHNLAAIIADRRGDQLWLQHSYRRDVQESINTSLFIKLTDRLTLKGRYERNLQDDRDILKGGGFLYTDQCWSVDFFYAKEGTDDKFAFSINLRGIGGFGN